MITPKGQYDLCTQTLINLNNKLYKLQKNPIVQEYMRLEKDFEDTKEEQEKWFQIMKTQEYDGCDKHVLVCTKKETQTINGRIREYKYCGCIKCGLDESVLKSEEKDRSLEDQVQYDYLRSKGQEGIQGLQTDIECGIALAQQLYEQIKDENDEFTDEQLVELFKLAFTAMKDKLKPTETDIHKSKFKRPNE